MSNLFFDIEYDIVRKHKSNASSEIHFSKSSFSETIISTTTSPSYKLIAARNVDKYSSTIFST
jgi:hypothetical protein